MKKRINRRELLKSATLAGAGVWIAGGAAPAADKSPNEKLDVAVVGCGHRGAANLGGVSSENIVALCDVDDRQAGKAFERYPRARKYRDFRKMLDEVGRRVDAVVVSTPDHTHAPAAVMAMKIGKHCYCEKPMAHSVHEVRTMREVAQKNKLATQLGTQIHAEPNYRRAVELVQSGAIGAVHEAHVWFGGSYAGSDRPKETPPVPPELDWDLWLGPAPYRPYHPCYLPGTWRRWWDFGTGAMGDFGCHYMDLPFWALGLRYPARVEAEGPPVHPEGTPAWMIVRYQFPGRGGSPPIRLTWYDGGKRPELVRQEKVPDWHSAVLFVGSKGMLLADYTKWKLLPESQFAGFEPPKPTIPDSVGHHREWIAACKSGGPTTCNFDYSGALSEAVLLGCAAYRSGKKLDWDAKQLHAKGCPEVDRFIRPAYRQGWTL
jgi:predicted dehydrogenase